MTVYLSIQYSYGLTFHGQIFIHFTVFKKVFPLKMYFNASNSGPGIYFFLAIFLPGH